MAVVVLTIVALVTITGSLRVQLRNGASRRDMDSRQSCMNDPGVDMCTCVWVYFRTKATTVELGQVA